MSLFAVGEYFEPFYLELQFIGKRIKVRLDTVSPQSCCDLIGGCVLYRLSGTPFRYLSPSPIFSRSTTRMSYMWVLHRLCYYLNAFMLYVRLYLAVYDSVVCDTCLPHCICSKKAAGDIHSLLLSHSASLKPSVSPTDGRIHQQVFRVSI